MKLGNNHRTHRWTNRNDYNSAAWRSLVQTPAAMESSDSLSPNVVASLTCLVSQDMFEQLRTPFLYKQSDPVSITTMTPNTVPPSLPYLCQ